METIHDGIIIEFSAEQLTSISVSVCGFVTHQLCMAGSNPCLDSCTASRSLRLQAPGTPSSPVGHSKLLLSLPMEQEAHMSSSVTEWSQWLEWHNMQLSALFCTNKNSYQACIMKHATYLPSISFRPVCTVAAKGHIPYNA